MNVLVVEPGILPYEKEINGLHEMQSVVGGLIDVIYPYDEMVGIVCNDEAILNHKPFNRSIEGGYGGVFGTFFVCGLTEESFTSLSPEQMEKYKEKFKKAEVLVGVKGNEPITIKTEAKPKDGKAAKSHEVQR
jgi:hypothetical protein